MEILPKAFEYMDTAVDYYFNGVDQCPEIEPSLEEWRAAIIAANEARLTSQKTCTDYIWGRDGIPGPNPGMVVPTFWGADGTIGEGMVNAIVKLRFGWGQDNVPAPYNDEARMEIFALSEVTKNFSRDLQRNSSQDISFDSDSMLREAELLTRTYVKEAKRNFPEFIYVHRFEMSARRSYVMNKALASACEVRRIGAPQYHIELHNHMCGVMYNYRRKFSRAIALAFARTQQSPSTTAHSV